MFTFIKVDFAKAALNRLASNNDLKTTVLGVAAGAIYADKTIDWGKLIQGDGSELGKMAGIMIGVAICYYTNKSSKAPAAK